MYVYDKRGFALVPAVSKFGPLFIIYFNLAKVDVIQLLACGTRGVVYTFFNNSLYL